ncbi:MAG: cytochrome c3 family protein [Bilophila wadsworthia]
MSEVSPRKCPWLKILLGGVALGVLVLAGLAWGMRVTDARPFCSSCHIMEQAARTHKLSPHAKLACNECHAPTALLSKLPFKAKEGARDFYMNTLGDVDLPIVAGIYEGRRQRELQGLSFCNQRECRQHGRQALLRRLSP